MKTLILFLVTLSSCTTIKTIPDFTIGKEHFEGSKIMYKHGNPVKWKSKSHPEWAEVEKSNVNGMITEQR